MKVQQKEIILSEISMIFGNEGFILKKNGIIINALKRSGLGEYSEEYKKYFNPNWYRTYNGDRYENDNKEYNIVLGFDTLFSELLNNETSKIIKFLLKIVDCFNVSSIITKYLEEYIQLKRLYNYFGLDLIFYEKESLNNESELLVQELESYELKEIDDISLKVTVSTYLKKDNIKNIFNLESWLQKNHSDVYDSFDGAINSYKNGNFGTCIESCRTSIVSILTSYKGTHEYAKWIKGIFVLSDESDNYHFDEFKYEKTEFSKSISEDLATFLNENKEGKMTKTKLIYMVYSFLSDYGTHRNETKVKNNEAVEKPLENDALFAISITESILMWIKGM